MMKRVQVVVEGRVQGVFFRAYAEDEARRLGLTGWVRNRPEGTVEVLAEGESNAVAELLHWLHQGSPQSLVTAVRVTEQEPLGDCIDFTTRY